MREVIVVSLADLGGTDTLAGSLRGQEMLTKMLAAASPEPNSPQPVFLDFKGVNLATASFLRESVITFRQIVRGRRSTLYPVIVNANPDVREELTELAKSRGEVLMTCCLDARGEATQPTLIGALDPKQALTYTEVVRRGETDASELMHNFKRTEKVGATAWNNRLSALVGLGLIMEVSQGRSKRYRALF